MLDSEEEKEINSIMAFMPRFIVKQKSHIVDIPKDQKFILKMLIRPEKYGIGLFDYSCHGANWNISEEVMQR